MAKKTEGQIRSEIDEALQSPIGKPPTRKVRARTKLSREAKKANDDLYKLTFNKYFGSVPLQELFAIVERAGFKFDPEERETILTGRSGRATWFLFDPDTDRDVDHMLVLNWHKMENSGRYEIVAYVS